LPINIKLFGDVKTMATSSQSNKLTQEQKKACTVSNQQVDGMNLALGLLGVGAIGYIYTSTESQYPGAGLQGLIYGSAIVGGVYMIATTLTGVYKNVRCFDIQ
jgi:hypothetical protein